MTENPKIINSISKAFTKRLTCDLIKYRDMFLNCLGIERIENQVTKHLLVCVTSLMYAAADGIAVGVRPFCDHLKDTDVKWIQLFVFALRSYRRQKLLLHDNPDTWNDRLAIQKRG